MFKYEVNFKKEINLFNYKCKECNEQGIFCNKLLLCQIGNDAECIATSSALSKIQSLILSGWYLNRYVKIAEPLIKTILSSNLHTGNLRIIRCNQSFVYPRLLLNGNSAHNDLAMWHLTNIILYFYLNLLV